MTDLHTHILPAIDDGSPDPSVSARQLAALGEQGVERIAFTPHYYGRKRSPREFLESRAAALERIRDILPRETEICLGAEIHVTAQLPLADEALCPLAIGDTRYILFELPFTSEWGRGIWRRIDSFMRETDYIPVIAHVERYSEVRKNPALASELKDMGCLLQVNTTAFLDKESKSLAFALLRHGLVHCLGTDTHNDTDRAPDYGAAKKAIFAAGCGEAFDVAQSLMEGVWNDKKLRLPQSKPVKKFFSRYY